LAMQFNLFIGIDQVSSNKYNDQRSKTEEEVYRCDFK